MFVKGDKIITTRDVFGISKGTIFEVTDVKGDLVKFEKKMENDRFISAMTINLMKEYFEKYEEPKITPIVDEDYIEYLISESELNIQTVFNKCTVVSCKLPNGFVIVESTDWESVDKYDEEIGTEICIEKIMDKLWELEKYKNYCTTKEELLNCCNCNNDSCLK